MGTKGSFEERCWCRIFRPEQPFGASEGPAMEQIYDADPCLR